MPVTVGDYFIEEVEAPPAPPRQEQVDTVPAPDMDRIAALLRRGHERRQRLWAD